MQNVCVPPIGMKQWFHGNFPFLLLIYFQFYFPALIRLQAPVSFTVFVDLFFKRVAKIISDRIDFFTSDRCVSYFRGRLRLTKVKHGIQLHLWA